MKMIKSGEKKFIGDKGSTLITVIVAIGFVTVLTAIILGTSVMNVRMKSIDRRSKDDFYYAEKALNDVYTGIGQKTAELAGIKYEDAFSDVGLPGADDPGFAETAEGVYKLGFISQTATDLELPSATPHDMSDTKAVLQDYIVPVSGVTSTVDSVADYRYETYTGGAASQDTADRIRLIGVQITSTDSKGFQATISTDIIIETPTMDFLGPNVDVTDYSIIANKGLYINGNTTINGNVYAGIHGASGGSPALPSGIDDKNTYGAEKLFGGININGKSGTGSNVTINGNYIVSKGDINLSGYKPKLTIGTPGLSDANLPNIYFDTMRTCADDNASNEKTINLNANIFALNDLELNADNSKVTIGGNYYGYNDKTLPDPSKITDTEAMHSLSGETGHDDSESSAIIVNGSSATLDMTNIKSLVLMGRAYVDFAKGAKDGSSLESDPADIVNVAPTAEGIALKTNQQLYLVPTDLLDSPNPAVKSAEFDPADSSKDSFKLILTDATDPKSQKIKDWFGYDFVAPNDGNSDKSDDDTSKIYKIYKVTMEDDSVVYYAYLNFNNKLWVADAGEPFGYKDVTDDSNYTPLGTHGSVSSMEAFFDIVMNDYSRRVEKEISVNHRSEADAKQIVDEYEEHLVAPSPHAIYERIALSMGYDYFDLQNCLIGNGSAILYSQNAVINYEKDGSEFKSEMLKNNTGMERYAAYPQNLFHRYQWITTRLDAHQNKQLQTDPAVDDEIRKEWKGDGSGYTTAAEAAPIGHFVALDRITDTTDTTSNIADAVDRGLAINGYGCCIVKKGDLTIKNGEAWVSGNTFKGVAIVDGNITVDSGITVYGLLMATGVVIVDGEATINNDKGLIQARIEKEIANVKSYPESEPVGVTPVPGGGMKNYYLINYLTQDRPIGADDTARTNSDAFMMYKISEGSKKKVDRIEADYHKFMFFENWQKGPNS